jgi:hypothetical protein
VKSVGYSGTPLLKKLGIKPDFKMMLVNTPKHYFKLLGKLPDGVQILSKPQTPSDFIHFFSRERKECEEKLPDLKKALIPNGIIWVSWPKGASNVPTDLNDNVVRQIALKNGLVDIKVCAVDEIWSGLKLVIPVKDRKG